LYFVVQCVGEKCQVAVDTYIATTPRLRTVSHKQ
jgi:hypothetical protein